MSKPTWNHAAIAVAGALMVALAAAPADAATLVASNPGSQLLQVAVSGPQVAVESTALRRRLHHDKIPTT